jgi:hypothetical protein
MGVNATTFTNTPAIRSKSRQATPENGDLLWSSCTQVVLTLLVVMTAPQIFNARKLRAIAAADVQISA